MRCVCVSLCLSADAPMVRFTDKGAADFASEEDRELWEEEQKRLDREWYGMDQGYDDSSNPFAGSSAEYTKKKEEEFEQKKKKRMSEKQRQINKVWGDFSCLGSFFNFFN